MRFEFRASSRIPGLAEVIWELQSPGAGGMRILPSGWVELIFRLGPVFSLRQAKLLDPDSGPTRAFCFLSGLHTRPLDMTFDSLHVFGVRLHPVAVRTLFGIPCAEVLDGAVEGKFVLDELSRLEDRLKSAPDFDARVQCIEEELLERLRRHGDPDAARRMCLLADTLPISVREPGRELDRMLGYSRSHAHRLFGEWLGQPATGAVRLARFVRATHAIHGGNAPFGEVAHRLGYYDQAHFNREFRAFAGMTPGEYRAHGGPAPEQIPL